MESLKDNAGNTSSMRINTRLITITAMVLMLAVAAYIIIHSIKGEHLDNAEWTGMGLFIGGVATLITGSSWMQQRQKKDELKS